MRKTTLATICLPLFLASATEGALVSSYQFTGGSLADGSGNGNDATVVGTLTNGAVTDGIRGDVFDLTGGSGSENNPGNYLNLPIAGGGTGSWTLAMWIKDGSSKNSYLFDNRDFGATGGDRLIFSTEHNVPGSGLGLFNGGWASASATIRDGNWHHVAWVFDGVGGTLTLYADGVGTSTSYSAADLLAESVRLGNRSGDGASGQGGRLIDDVFVYSSALSSSEVNALMNIPEPSAMSLLGLGAVLLLRRRR